MKNKTLLLNYILIIALSSVFQFAQAQWTKKDAGYSGNPRKGINELIAVNANIAWGFAYERYSAFVNPLTDFTRTIDGGNHWIAGNISSYPDQFIVGACPVSAATAYVLSGDANFFGKVLKTTNGGITWAELTVAPYHVFYQNIQFFNANDGVVFGDTVTFSSAYHFMFAYTTNDGGTTWQAVPYANLPAHDSTENFYPFSSTVIGDTIWTVSTNARVWRSVDKGIHWTANQTAETEAVVSNIKMRDAMNGLWGINDELYRTSDGGITWTEVHPAGTFFTFDLSYVPGTVSTWVSTGGDTSSVDFFTGGIHGLGSSYSLDDGNTWITIDTGVDHLALAMVNSYTGFCGGFNKANGKGGVFTYTGSALGNTCGNNLTSMCYQGQTECVTHNYIKWILNHGGALGACQGERMTVGTSSVDAVSVYPNPFSEATTISFSLPQPENVSLKIFDVDGRFIRTLANERMSASVHTLTWDARNENDNAVSAGIYFLRMETASQIETIQLNVVK